MAPRSKSPAFWISSRDALPRLSVLIMELILYSIYWLCFNVYWDVRPEWIRNIGGSHAEDRKIVFDVFYDTWLKWVFGAEDPSEAVLLVIGTRVSSSLFTELTCVYFGVDFV
jgi:hypothetical protein